MTITITPASIPMQDRSIGKNATDDLLYSQAILPDSTITMSDPIIRAFISFSLAPSGRPNGPLEDDEEIEQPEMTEAEYNLLCEAQAQEHDEVIDMAYEDALIREFAWYR